MELLKEIASVSGKGGLFRILKPTRNGVILETLDEKKSKLVANANERVSILKEISIYTTGAESSKPLEEILVTIKSTFGESLGVTTKSSEAELRAFLSKVLPDYDEEKVYASDIKKLVSWYEILVKFFPEALVIEEKKETATEALVQEEGEVKEKPKAKAKAKKEEDSTEEKPKAKATKAKAKKE
ncbi:MAG: DUF5606 domain-containing protein [Cytophagaceae bacterium]|nr:DUF5606 domain-containing protein [Cytophagaceae bacterium]